MSGRASSLAWGVVCAVAYAVALRVGMFSAQITCWAMTMLLAILPWTPPIASRVRAMGVRAGATGYSEALRFPMRIALQLPSVCDAVAHPSAVKNGVRAATAYLKVEVRRLASDAPVVSAVNHREPLTLEREV